MEREFFTEIDESELEQILLNDLAALSSGDEEESEDDLDYDALKSQIEKEQAQYKHPQSPSPPSFLTKLAVGSDALLDAWQTEMQTIHDDVVLDGNRYAGTDGQKAPDDPPRLSLLMPTSTSEETEDLLGLSKAAFDLHNSRASEEREEYSTLEDVACRASERDTLINSESLEHESRRAMTERLLEDISEQTVKKVEQQTKGRIQHHDDQTARIEQQRAALSEEYAKLKLEMERMQKIRAAELQSIERERRRKDAMLRRQAAVSTTQRWWRAQIARWSRQRCAREGRERRLMQREEVLTRDWMDHILREERKRAQRAERERQRRRRESDILGMEAEDRLGSDLRQARLEEIRRQQRLIIEEARRKEIQQAKALQANRERQQTLRKTAAAERERRVEEKMAAAMECALMGLEDEAALRLRNAVKKRREEALQRKQLAEKKRQKRREKEKRKKKRLLKLLAFEAADRAKRMSAVRAAVCSVPEDCPSERARKRFFIDFGATSETKRSPPIAVKAALLLQSLFRGFRCRGRLKEWHAAATAIQSCWRGSCCRDWFYRTLSGLAFFQALWRGYRERWNPCSRSNTRRELRLKQRQMHLTSAVGRLQALARGHRARRVVQDALHWPDDEEEEISEPEDLDNWLAGVGKMVASHDQQREKVANRRVPMPASPPRGLLYKPLSGGFWDSAERAPVEARPQRQEEEEEAVLVPPLHTRKGKEGEQKKQPLKVMEGGEESGWGGVARKHRGRKNRRRRQLPKKESADVRLRRFRKSVQSPGSGAPSPRNSPQRGHTGRSVGIRTASWMEKEETPPEDSPMANMWATRLDPPSSPIQVTRRSQSGRPGSTRIKRVVHSAGGSTALSSSSVFPLSVSALGGVVAQPKESSSLMHFESDDPIGLGSPLPRRSQSMNVQRIGSSGGRLQQQPAKVVSLAASRKKARSVW